LIFVDESSFAMSGNQFTTYAPRGKGVALARYQSVTERVYGISGITPEGDIHSAVQTRPFCSKHIVKFLKQLLDELKGKIHLVWDNASIHFSELVKIFLRQDQQAERLWLYALPTYSPDFNPDEQVWNHLKNQKLIRMEFNHKTQLAQELETQLQNLKDEPQLIGSFFQHPDVGFL